MGALWARFRKKPSTKDVLEKIRTELNDIEEFNKDTQAWHKKVIGNLLAYFSVLYLLAAAVAYFRYLPRPEWRSFGAQLQLLAPFIVAPLIFVTLKKVLTWWYHRKIRKNQVQLEKLKVQKAKILDEVMEKETYKVAKEILDEYAPEKSRSSFTPRPTTTTTTSNNREMELRRRNVQTPASSANQQPQTGTGSGPKSRTTAQTGNLGASFIQDNNGGSPRNQPQRTPVVLGQSAAPHRPGPPLPRPVLPRERGYMDRVVEYLVGDGPSNRYALICRQCQSHNGMALKEEFEFIAYRCCYCHYWNPARKQRPVAPRLESRIQKQSSVESTSTNSEDEDEVKSNQPSSASPKSCEEEEPQSHSKSPERKQEDTTVSQADLTTTSDDSEEKKDDKLLTL